MRRRALLLSRPPGLSLLLRVRRRGPLSAPPTPLLLYSAFPFEAKEPDVLLLRTFVLGGGDALYYLVLGYYTEELLLRSRLGYFWRRGKVMCVAVGRKTILRPLLRSSTM